MRYAVRIVTPPNYPHSAAFREVANSLRAGLADLGIGEETPASGGGLSPDTRFVLLGPALLGKNDPPPGTVLYNLEQVPEKLDGASWFSPAVIDRFRRFETWDYSAQNVMRLRRFGIEAKLVPIGYHPCLTTITRAAEPDIDVLFYGSLNARREQVLARLAHYGAKVHHAFGVYGAERDALIARSKIVLNMHFYDAQVFEIVRCSHALANEAAVVSEIPIEPGFEDAIVWARYDTIAGACMALIDNAKLREETAARGFAAIRARPVTEYLRAALL